MQRLIGLVALVVAPTVFIASERPLERAAIVAAMDRVCAWQLENFRTQTLNRAEKDTAERIPENGWIRGTAYAGVLAHYRVTSDATHLNAALKWAGANAWKLGPQLRHADDQCVAQAYAELFMLKKDPVMIADARRVFDTIVAEPQRGPIVGWIKGVNWAWCDALFMAPPALARLAQATGDHRYLELLNTFWWDTHAYLYDRTEHLYYRDAKYFIAADGTGPRTPSGEKVFWARGNGWVLAGLARTLQFLPADFRDRPRYVALLREMAERVAVLQQPDGLWRSSLNDPAWYPAQESSSTALFCFALAYGVNTQLLERARFAPVAEAAWRGLLTCVEPSGKIGWVQLTGHDPRPVFAHDTLDYAAGAFLLAGEQLIELVDRSSH